MLMSGYQTALQLSALAGFWGAFASHATFASASPFQWQVPVAIQLLPGVLLLLGTLLIPETPRFRAERGDFEAAEDALAWLRGLPHGDPDLSRELDEIQEAAEASLRVKSHQRSFFSEAMKKGVRQRLFVGIGLMIAQNMVGLNALNYCESRQKLQVTLCDLLMGCTLRCACYLHVSRLHFGFIVPFPHRGVWRRQTCLCRRFHVCFCTHERQSILAQTGLRYLRVLNAGFRCVNLFPMVSDYDRY